MNKSNLVYSNDNQRRHETEGLPLVEIWECGSKFQVKYNGVHVYLNSSSTLQGAFEYAIDHISFELRKAKEHEAKYFRIKELLK